jgi:hypothetical protein
MFINEYCFFYFATEHPINTSTDQFSKKKKKRDTHLCQLRSYTAHNVDVHHVWLRPERSQARPLQGFPPLGKLVKSLVTLARVNLNLKLADGQGLQGVLGDERRECVKFAAFDVNFEDVDERVT